MPRNEGEISHQTALAGSAKVFVSFLGSFANCDQIRMYSSKSKVNKRFDMVPGNFEKVPDDKAVLSEYCRLDEI